MADTRYIVTGSSGFVGTRLLPLLAGRHEPLHLGADGWAQRIASCRFEGAVVLHLAARAHRSGSEDAFRRDNVEKTRALADAAARGKARRLVFLSSIKVNGEETSGRAFTPHDAPGPEDAYGRSKRDAEAVIAGLARTSAVETVVVRSPIVLGAPAKGQLARLLALCDSPWPLPVAAIRNRRSFIHVEDLARALVECADRPFIAGRTYLVSHREPFSTPQLVDALRAALGRPRRLFPMPPAMLLAAGRLLGQRAAMRRLVGSLEADPADAERDLAWTARIGLEEAALEMARDRRAARP